MVITSDMMSSSLEFQRDSVIGGCITGMPNLYNVCPVISSHVVVASLLSEADFSALMAARLATMSLDQPL